jgi:hypothetical protein
MILKTNLEMKNSSVREHIQTSATEYRRGAASDAHDFLAELKKPSGEYKKK